MHDNPSLLGSALLAIDEQPKETLTLTKLANKLAVGLPVTCKVVHVLQARGLVMKQRSTSGMRMGQMVLTEHGKLLYFPGGERFLNRGLSAQAQTARGIHVRVEQA